MLLVPLTVPRRRSLHIFMLTDSAGGGCQVAVLFAPGRPDGVDVHVLLEVRDGLLVQVVCGAEARGGFGVDARAGEVAGLGGCVGVRAVDCDVVEGLAAFVVLLVVAVDGGGVVIVGVVVVDFVVGVLFVRGLLVLDGFLEAVVARVVL